MCQYLEDLDSASCKMMTFTSGSSFSSYFIPLFNTRQTDKSELGISLREVLLSQANPVPSMKEGSEEDGGAEFPLQVVLGCGLKIWQIQFS